MLAVERRAKIAALITENKSVLVQDLSKMFSVTEETIRRDLEKLEKQGILIKTYGGAVLAENSKGEISVEIRQEINTKGKDAIGKIAAGMVADGEVIMLDASTSALYVAKHIKAKKGLTVITNSEKIVLELAGCDDITIISTGGIFRHKNYSYVGKTAENVLSGYYATKAFLSCKGLSLARGLTDSNEQEADIRKMMIKCSEKVIALCDHTKFNQAGFINTAGFDDIDCIITDGQLPEGWKEKIESQGVQVISDNM